MAGEHELLFPSSNLFPRQNVVQGRVRGAMGRGKSWNRKEELALVRAWIRTSENPLVGTDEKAVVFWKAALENFVSLATDYRVDVESEAAQGRWKHRNWRSLQSHFGTISAACQKFQGVYERVRSSRPTGFSSDDDFIKGAIIAPLIKSSYSDDRCT